MADDRLVGRKSEKERLKQAFADSANGHGGSIFLSGPAGIGKTALAEYASNIAAESGFTVLRSVATMDSGIPFHLFSRALGGITDAPLFDEQERVSFSQLLAINTAGMLIAKASNEEEELDADIFAGMLTAVQSFVRDSFDPSGAGNAGLGRLEYGNLKILIEHAEGMFLVAVLRGQEHPDMARNLKRHMRELASMHGDAIKKWSGSTSQVQPIADSLAEIIKTRFLVRKDLEGVKIEAERIRISENILDILKKSSDNGPVLLALEDIHWADDNSLFALKHVARNLQGNRIMVLATYRSREKKEFDALIESMKIEAKSIEICLANLEAHDTKTLIDRLYDPNVIPAGFISKLAAQCQGNPFFIKELLAQMASDGAIARNGEQYILEREDYEIPKSVEDVIDRRLVTLEPDAMAMAEFASCFGRDFPVNMVQNTHSVPDPGLALNKLQMAGILSRCNGSAEFSHALFQNVVYDNMSDRWKSLHHLQIAKMYEDRFKENLDAVLFELARHYAKTREHQKTVEYCIRAAEKAEASYAMQEAIELYRQALRAFDTSQERGKIEKKAEILERLADALYIGERLDEAMETYIEAYNCYDDRKDRSRIRRKRSMTFDLKCEFDAAIKEAEFAESEAESGSPEMWLGLHQRASVYTKKGMNRESLEAAIQARENLEKHDAASDVISKIDKTIGISHWHLGDYDKALEYFMNSLNIGIQRNDRRDIARGYHNLALVNMDLGNIEKSIELQKKTLEIDLELKNIRGLANSYGNISVFYQRMGKFKEALEWAFKGEAEFKKLGDRYGLARTYLNVGVIQMEMGDFAGAEPSYIKGGEMFKELGNRFGTALGTYFLGLVKHQLGDLEDARKYARESMEINQEIGEKQRLIASRLLLATMLNEEKKYAEAEAMFREDLETSREMKDMEGMVCVAQALASCLTSQNKLDEAKKLLDISLEQARQSNMKSYEAAGLHFIGNLNQKLGKLDEAFEMFKKSRELFGSLDAKTEEARVMLNWGKALRIAGKDDSGLIEKALEVFEKHGMKIPAMEAKEALGWK